jgi:SAM-dependent methyltransferase
MRYRCATSALGYHSIAPATTREGPENRPSDQPVSVPYDAPTPLRTRRRLPAMEQDEKTAVLSKSFGSVADDYDRLRSGPPAEALNFLLPEPATDVLEIGAGTGILTRLLVERVPHVTAVEPDDRMRALLAASTPGVEAVQGQAEGLPAPGGSYDVVVAQSAWHWVDEARAVPEVARVLRPHGRLSLAWTGTDRSVDWMRSLWAGGIEMDSEEKEAIDSGRRRRHRVNMEAAGPSPFGEPETRLFRWTRAMSKGDLVALAATYSGVIVMDDDARRQHLDAMMRYLDGHETFSGTDIIDVPMRSYCWRATKR